MDPGLGLRPIRGLVLAIFALTSSACATAPAPRAINAPSAVVNTVPPLNLEGDVLALSFSGGGARAAAFSLGALEGLREMHARDGRPLTEHVRLITAVSGGSVLAGYIGERGMGGIDTFRAAYLDKNWAGELHTSPLSPLNWARAWSGGLNERGMLADWLDREVYGGGAVRELWSADRPHVWINATDLYNGTPFAFAPAYFDAICSDLGNTRIADAVAASMAVPVAFRPILIQPHPEQCAPQPAWVTRAQSDRTRSALERRTAQAFVSYRDPARLPYVHLVDGGVVDNLGLSALTLAQQTSPTPYGPLSDRDAVRLTRLTFLIVNAEKVRDSDWQQTARGPSGAQQLDAFFDIAIESPNRAAYDAFRTNVAQWREAIVTWRCALSRDDVIRLRGDANGWDCRALRMDVDMISFGDLDAGTAHHLGTAETAVSLPRALVNDLIAGGRQAVSQNALARSLTH